MSYIPIVHAKTMEKLLFGLGFQAVQQRGSHVLYRHPDGRTTSIPHHPGRDLAVPLVREILREIHISVDEFKKMVEHG